MAAQTSYTVNQAEGKNGMQYDIGFNDVISRAADSIVGIGRVVSRGTNAVTQCKNSAASADITDRRKILGVALDDGTRIQPYGGLTGEQYAATEAVSILQRGRVWVAMETDWLVSDTVYARYSSSAAVAQVDTMTPTAVNSTLYTVTINGTAYTYTSDGSATAAEIVTGLTTAINADLVLPVTASGSTTLILTADVAGTAFVATGDANLANVHTTANDTLQPNLGMFRANGDTPTSAAAFPTAKFCNQGTSGGLALIEFDLLGS